MCGKSRVILQPPVTRILHSFLAVFTAALLLFGTVPKDFMHSWTGHTDTVHSYEDGEHATGFVFENEHHHCRFLKLLVTAFGAPVILQYHPLFFLSHTTQEIAYSYIAAGVHPSQRCLRGPPCA